jgi:hypothetical protein
MLLKDERRSQQLLEGFAVKNKFCLLVLGIRAHRLVLLEQRF